MAGMQLPEGYVLDSPPSSISVPNGYVLDSPAPTIDEIDAKYEKQIKDANENQSFLGNVGEGISNLAHGNIHDTALGRGAERGVTGLMQIGGDYNPIAYLAKKGTELYTGEEGSSAPKQDLVDIAKQTRIAGQGTGVSGAIGETLLDSRFSALPATGPMGWMGRTATGAAIGATNPVETTDQSKANEQRIKSATETGTAFAVAPPIIDKLVGGTKKIVSPIISKIIGNAQDIIPPAYDRVAKTLVEQEAYTPAEAIKAVQTMTTKDGMPLTLPEAIGSDRLLKEQRVLGELSTPAGTNFSEFNKNRIENVLPDAKQGLIDSLGGNTSLTDAGSSIQDASKNFINKAIDERRAATAPAYESIKLDAVPSDVLQNLRSNPSIDKAYQKVIANDALTERQYKFIPTVPAEYKSSIGTLSPQAQAQAMEQLGIKPEIQKVATGGLPEDSIGFWHKVKQELDSNYEKNEFGKATPEGRLAKIAGSQVNDALETVNPLYATTNSDYAAKSADIQSLMRSPLGKINNAKTPEQAANIFMGLSREQLKDVIPKISQTDPTAVPQMAASYMQQLTDKTSDGGLKSYVNIMSKNDMVRDRMKSILGNDGFDAQQALVENVKKVLSGQPRNSETIAKAEILKGLNSSGDAVNTAFDVATGGKAGLIKKGLQWISGLKTQAGAKLNEASHKQLMDVFINPDLDKLGVALKNASDAQKQSAILQYIGEQVSGGAIANQTRTPTSQQPVQGYSKGGSVKPRILKKLKAAQGTGKSAPLMFPADVVRQHREAFFDGKKPRTVEQAYKMLGGT